MSRPQRADPGPVLADLPGAADGGRGAGGTEPRVSEWDVRRLEGVAAALFRPPVGGRRSVIAIDGRSASGKTTLARALAATRPGTAIVSTDDVSWYESFFDWADLLADHVLRPARSGATVAYRPPAWDERGRPGAIEVPAGSDTVILEGVGAARRELAELIDVVVWIQADPATVRARGIARDRALPDGRPDVEAFWDAWMAEEEPFLEADRPWSRASLIVAGTTTLDHRPGIELVVASGPLAP